MRIKATVERFFFLVCVTVITACSLPEPDANISMSLYDALDDPTKFETLFQDRADDLSISSAAMIYHKDGETLSAFTGEGIDENSLFQAASLSKAVAAVGIILLADQHGVGLNDDIRPHTTSLNWQEIKGADEPVTLRALLSHTAGATVGGFAGYHRRKLLPSSVSVVTNGEFSHSSAVHLTKEKGTFSYSGGGYQIAQVFAEDISGLSFGDAMKTVILNPFGMEKSTFQQPIDPEALGDLNIAGANSRFYLTQGIFRPLKNSWHNYPEQAAAGLWTTPDDYAKFLSELLDAIDGQSSVLSKQLAQEIVTDIDGNYALGVMLDKDDIGDLNYYWHTGLNAGYNTIFRMDPESEEIVVVMTNTQAGAVLAREVADAVVK